jgi:vancomycin resistance protein YoaR
MSSTSYVRKPAPRALSRLEETLTGLFLGILLFLVSLVIFALGYQVWYLGRVIPGVALAGQAVEGLTPTAAAEKISGQITYPNSGHILLYDPTSQKSWKLAPAQLGLLLDPQASAQAAMRVGRSNNPLTSFEEQMATWIFGEDVPPVMVFDERLGNTMLMQVAAEIDQPMVNAGLSLKGTEVTTVQSQTGRRVDIAATLAQIRRQTQTLQDGAVALVILEEQPTVLDVSQQAAQVRSLLSQPLTLSLPDDQADKGSVGPWVLDPPTLANMLSFSHIQKDGKTILDVTISRQALLAYLSPLAPKLQQSKQNARFTFDDKSGQLQLLEHATIGRTLNLQNSIGAIEEKAFGGAHNIALQLDIDKPQATDDKSGADLGIRELVHQEISYFYGSSAERVQNIKAASSRFHGYLVAPGEVLSMATVMGDVSLDTGYAEALIIAGGKTIKGVGGGVCQVSTTLFRAAFFTGFPIIERWPHAYRVGYYEYDPNGRRSPQYAGLDATVFVPVVDFKFKNDSSSWLLMETYVNPTYGTLIWKFYGTKDGRMVEWNTSGPTNTVDHPKDLYRENTSLPAGEVKQVDYAADGADVSVHRIVRREGAVLSEDNINTHYEAWQAVYEYGPGTDGMPPPDSANQ